MAPSAPLILFDMPKSNPNSRPASPTGTSTFGQPTPLLAHQHRPKSTPPPSQHHPTPSLPAPGTVSNRPPLLALDTSSLSNSPAGSSHSAGVLESAVVVSSSRARTAVDDDSPASSPINRFASFSPTPHLAHQQHALRQSHTPTHSLSGQASTARPQLVSYHSHLVPAPPTTWLGRQLACCRSPATGQLEVPVGLTPYVPFACWGATSLGFVCAFTFWREELWSGLDSLSVMLAAMGFWGRVTMGLLIFLTTIPPLPLYSTLIILSGYAFGAWVGFIISYLSALSGAIVVFLLSRSLFRTTMIRLLSRSPSLARVIHAIERKPSLLFLIRLAPYPYNVMNTLLASSRTLSLKMYSGITAVSLLKLIIHTTIGASIHDWSGYHANSGSDAGSSTGDNESSAPTRELTPEEAQGEMLRKAWSIIGIGLCIALFIYLTLVARRAVDQTTISAPDSPVILSSAYTRLPTTDSSGNGDGDGSSEEMSELELVHERLVGQAVGRVLKESAEGRQHGGRPLSVSGMEEVVGVLGGGGGSGGGRGRAVG